MLSSLLCQHHVSPLLSLCRQDRLQHSSVLLFRSSVIPRAACGWSAAGRMLFSKKNIIAGPYLRRRQFSNVRAQMNEEDKARSAAGLADTGGPTIFDKIIKKEIPSTVVYEDEKVLAFHDINPQAPVHIILIPKIRDGLTQLSKAEERHKDILGHLMYATGVIAKQEGIQDGYRVVINNGPTACQSVYHLHLHIIGGRQLKWPPG